MKRSLMTGIDLHSNNLVCGIVDAHGRRVFDKKLPCQLATVIAALKPFKNRIDTIAVESTYNWYWLVDGLQDSGYKVALANPAQMEQYNGIKHTDDISDAFFLAEMLRLKILPTGYICDRKLRPVRDLLRRRMGLVQKRTSLMLSLGSLYTRMTGQQMAQNEIKKLEADDAKELFDDPSDQLITELQLKLLEQFDDSIARIESAVLKRATKMSTYKVLQSIPGIGKILGMTISLETVDPKRFPSAGDFASYCRCVDSRRISNGKKKGENNAKCGNKYLGWAFVEAANFARRYDLQCRRFYDRKAAQTNSIVATKALACKLAKAAWHMMSENTEYDAARIFPAREQTDLRERLENHQKGLATNQIN
jgi:transposase